MEELSSAHALKSSIDGVYAKEAVKLLKKH